MKVKVPLFELDREALERVMVSIATLSLATAVNTTVLVFAEDLSSIALPVALLINDVIVGF